MRLAGESPTAEAELARHKGVLPNEGPMLSRRTWYLLRAAKVVLGAVMVAFGVWFFRERHPTALVETIYSAVALGYLGGIAIPPPWSYTQYRRRLQEDPTSPRSP